MYGDSLTINLDSIEDAYLVGIPIYAKVVINNVSRQSIELPELDGTSIGWHSNTICKAIVSSNSNNRTLDQQFVPNSAYSFKSVREMPLQILNPGKAEVVLFEVGKPISAGEYTLQLGCDFYSDIKEYEKHNYSLNHKIFSGNILSNQILLKVNDPTGEDQGILNDYVNNPSIGRHDVIHLMSNNPQSKYTLYLAIKYLLDSRVFTGHYSLGSFGMEERICIQASHRPANYQALEEIDRVSLEKSKIIKNEIEALAKLIEHHEKSLYVYPLMYTLALDYLGRGNYEKAYYYFELIKNAQPKLKQDEKFIASSSIFCEYIKKYLI